MRSEILDIRIAGRIQVLILGLGAFLLLQKIDVLVTFILQVS